MAPAETSSHVIPMPDADLNAIRATCKKYRLKGLDAVLAELQS